MVQNAHPYSVAWDFFDHWPKSHFSLIFIKFLIYSTFYIFVISTDGIVGPDNRFADTRILLFTLKRIQILLFTLMRIRILLFNLVRIQIRIQLPTFMRIRIQHPKMMRNHADLNKQDCQKVLRIRKWCFSDPLIRIPRRVFSNPGSNPYFLNFFCACLKN